MALGVVEPLCEAEEFAPLGWFVMNEAEQILLQSAVEHLRLAVALRMVGSAHPQLGPTKPKEFTPELADEDGVPIGN